MVHNQSVKKDEIDLFELIETLWAGKATLAFCWVIGLVFCALYVSILKPSYTIKISYILDLKPPLIEQQAINSDIYTTFYNEKTFSQWKDGAPGIALDYEMLGADMLIGDMVFEVEADKKTVRFFEDYIEINSNDIGQAHEISNYFQFVGDTLTARYTTEIKEERDRRTVLPNQLSSSAVVRILSGQNFLETNAALESYLAKAATGRKLVVVSKPTVPVKTNLNSSLLVISSFIVSSILGSMIILIKNAYRLRKLRLVEPNI